MPDEPVIRLDNDLVQDRITVEVQGYRLQLDPRAYTVETEILLDRMQEREQVFIDADDITGRIDFLVSLLVPIIKGKALPNELTDPRRLLTKLREVHEEHGEMAMLNHVNDRLSAIEEELNPGWNAQTIRERFSANAIGRVLNFYVGISTGRLPTQGVRPVPTPSEEAVPSTSAGAAQSAQKKSRPRASGRGAA